MRRLLGAALVMLSLVLAAPPLAARERVDLLLVLAADVSRSVDGSKFKLQRTGYAEAISDPRVLEAIKSGGSGRIAVTFVEWAGSSSQKVLIDWSVIDGPEAARKFADQLLEEPRAFYDRTSISAGIDFAMTLFESAPFEADRRTIDVSGDGTNNSGREVTAARDDAVRKGVTINALAILSDMPTPWNPEHTNPVGGLPAYFEKNVIGGPGAFVIVAEDFGSFGKAILNKLIAEIAALPPGRHAGLASSPLPEAGR
jgi:hypothetical protein